MRGWVGAIGSILAHAALIGLLVVAVRANDLQRRPLRFDVTEAPVRSVSPAAGEPVQKTADIPAAAAGWVGIYHVGMTAKPERQRRAAPVAVAAPAPVAAAVAAPVAVAAPAAVAAAVAVPVPVPAESPDPSAISQAIQSALHYPRIAREQLLEGRVLVRFRIDSAGDATDAAVLQSAGDILDSAALDAIRRAAPFRSPPGWVRVPVEFSLRATR